MVYPFSKPLLSTHCMQTWLKVLPKQHEVNTPLPREAHTAASQWRKKKRYAGHPSVGKCYEGGE